MPQINIKIQSYNISCICKQLNIVTFILLFHLINSVKVAKAIIQK